MRKPSSCKEKRHATLTPTEHDLIFLVELTVRHSDPVMTPENITKRLEISNEIWIGLKHFHFKKSVEISL